MLPAPATHLYKYQSAEHFDRLRHLLLNHELYFPTVTALNDPADCRPRLVSTSPRHLTRFLIRVWARNHPEATLLDIAAEFPRAYGGLQQMGVENALRAMTTQLHEHS